MKPVDIKILTSNDVMQVINISKVIFNPTNDDYHKEDVWRSYMDNVACY